MNTKKLVALLLSVLMLVSILPVSAMAADGTDYELRVLTFEDADYKGGTNFAGGSNWTSLIDNPQYGGSMLYPGGSGTTDESKAYTWYDAGNTELKHMLPKSWDNYCYWGGGHAVSNYVSSDFEAHGTYNDQLTVYSKNASTGIDTTGGGHNGSNNFAVHFGYKDNSGYTDSQILPSFAFGDGSEHVIDHMYVNNICYALNCYLNGNGLTAKIGDDDWVKLTATGYDAKGTKTGDASIYLCNGPKNIITDWTKFDLSGLGKVQKVEFNITGSSDNGYGFSQPAYFAYDDVAVRFEKAAPQPWDGTTQTEPALVDGVYQIGTAEELAWFGAQTKKTGKSGISGVLTNDIDLGGHDWSSCMIGATSSYGTGFSGTFDGAGHTIKGFALTKSIKGNSNSTYGFVGFAENADIKNFTLEGTIVLDFSACTETARVFHSGMIAYSKGCTISGITSNVASRIENDANGYATGYMGGILGVAGSSTASGSETCTLIENCVNNGALSAGTEAGGIVCRTFKGTVIRNCLNTGSITAVGITVGNAGGIAGQIAGSTIEGCANYGAITGTSDVGGIAGFMEGARSNSVNWASTVQNCYNTGACYSTALGKSSNGVGGVIGSANGYTSQKLYSELKNCYSTGAVGFDASSAYASKSYAGGVTGDAFYVNGSNVYYLDTVAAKANGENSTLRVNFTDVTAKTADELKSDDVLTLLGSGFKKDLGKVNGGYPVLSWQKSEPVEEPVNGERISNADELLAFAEKVSAGETTLDATVVANIDMTENTTFAGIGTEANPYAGNFDGGSFTITLNTTVPNSTAGTNYRAGVIAFASGATVRNVVMGGKIDAYNGCGIVGCAIGEATTTIENCTNKAKLTGSNPCGGILGEAKAPATIRNCSNSGSIYYGGYNGGILGMVSAEGCLVENCSNTGAISTSDNGSYRHGGIIGGVEGKNCTVRACYNTGEVKANSNVGGIIGSAEHDRGSGLRVESCFNTGSVTATYINGGQYGVGGIVGTTAYNPDVVISNVYNTGSVASNGGGSKYAGAGGIVGYIYENTTIENAYNTGAVSAAGTTSHGSILGTDLRATNKFVNVYWLEGSDTVMFSGVSQAVEGMVDASTADELKAMAPTLGAGFKADTANVNGGYPVLTWQPGDEEPVPPTTKAYTVAVGDGSSIAMGETANITLTVGHEEETAYNAYHFTVTYDAEKLSYTGINTDAAVKDENGTLTVSGYGADKTCGTDNIILTFTAKATGEAVVTVTAANIDKADNANTQDAPAATIEPASATIVIGGYTVTLPEDFTGADTAAPNEDYTFTAKDTHYDYDFSGSTMGGENVEVVDNGDGTFTVKNVTGNIVIQNTKTPKTYTVTVAGNGAADATAAAVAAYLTDYTFTVAQDDKYTYDVTATVNGADYGLTLANGTYTIAGADVIGNIVITVNKEAKPVTTTSITFEGSGSADVKGGTTQIATNGQDFQFELNAEAGYDYTVKLGEDELSAVDGKYTIPGEKLTGAALTVTVEKTAKQTITVDVNEYVKLDGKTMWLVTASGTVSDGKVLAYDGTTMFWSEKYNAYAYLVISDKSLDEIKTEAAAKVAEAAADKTELIYNFDVNETGNVDVNDAQLTYNMYNAKYDSFEAVSMQKFLNADVNGNKVLDTLDSTAIVNHLLGK